TPTTSGGLLVPRWYELPRTPKAYHRGLQRSSIGGADANPQSTGSVIDQVVREAPARHQRQRLPGGSHLVRAGDRHVVCISAVSDSYEFDHPLMFPRAECPPRRCALIGRGMGVRGVEHHDVTQPARLELISGGVEDAAICEPVPAVLP